MAKAVSTPRAEITNETYEQMARELTRASERMWDSVFDVAPFDSGEEAIKLDKLWPILNKYLKKTNDD